MMESFTPDKGGEFAEKTLNQDWWGWLRQRLHYMAGDFTQPDTFKALADKLGDGNAIFYLAVADRFFGTIIDQLHAAELTKQKDGTFRRVVIEKPFGHDLASAKELNAHILSELDEKPDLPDRPFPRQGDGAEHHGVAVQQRHLRAAVEPRSHRQRADHRIRDGRRRAARQVLRGRQARCATWCRTTCSSSSP